MLYYDMYKVIESKICRTKLKFGVRNKHNCILWYGRKRRL